MIECAIQRVSIDKADRSSHSELNGQVYLEIIPSRPQTGAHEGSKQAQSKEEQEAVRQQPSSLILRIPRIAGIVRLVGRDR